jgi:hypothetical protein
MNPPADSHGWFRFYQVRSVMHSANPWDIWCIIPATDSTSVRKVVFAATAPAGIDSFSFRPRRPLLLTRPGDTLFVIADILAFIGTLPFLENWPIRISKTQRRSRVRRSSDDPILQLRIDASPWEVQIRCFKCQYDHWTEVAHESCGTANGPSNRAGNGRVRSGFAASPSEHSFMFVFLCIFTYWCRTECLAGRRFAISLRIPLKWRSPQTIRKRERLALVMRHT